MKKQYNACGFDSNEIEIPKEDAYGVIETAIEDEIRNYFDTQFVFVGSICENKHKYIIVCQLDVQLQLIAELESILALTVCTMHYAHRSQTDY